MKRVKKVFRQIKNYGMHYCKVFGKWQYSCDHYECNK